MVTILIIAGVAGLVFLVYYFLIRDKKQEDVNTEDYKAFKVMYYKDNKMVDSKIVR